MPKPFSALSDAAAQALVDGLRESSEAPAILSFLARIEWPKAHGGEACPFERIPDAEVLAAWLPKCPESTWSDLRTNSGGILGRSDGQSITFTLIEAAIYGFAVEFRDGRKPGALAGIPNAHDVAGTVEALHRRWVDLPDSVRGKHPLGPLVKAWQDRPQPVDPDERDQGILPLGLLPDQPHHAGSLKGLSAHRIRVSRRELPAPGAIIEPEPQGLLPFGGEPPSATPRPVPLVLIDATGIGALQPGRGARLDKRLLIYSLLAMPLSQRRAGGRYELRRTVRELAAEIWPNTWRPGKHGETLVLALNAMHFAKVRMSDGGYWLPAVMRREPNPRDPSSEAVIQLELPSDCDRGPLIDRPQLVMEGVRSDPAFDLWLGLAYYWDMAKARNGGHRIYATRPKARRNRQGHLLDTKGESIMLRGGKPATDWRHPRAVLDGFERHPQAHRVPWLTPDQVRRLAYGGPDRGKTKQQRSRELQRSRALLRKHEREERVVIEADGPCWRILEAWPARSGPAQDGLPC